MRRREILAALGAGLGTAIRLGGETFPPASNQAKSPRKRKAAGRDAREGPFHPLQPLQPGPRSEGHGEADDRAFRRPDGRRSLLS